jgi:hypothetical protein
MLKFLMVFYCAACTGVVEGNRLGMEPIEEER